MRVSDAVLAPEDPAFWGFVRLHKTCKDVGQRAQRRQTSSARQRAGFPFRAPVLRAPSPCELELITHPLNLGQGAVLQTAAVPGPFQDDARRAEPANGAALLYSLVGTSMAF